MYELAESCKVLEKKIFINLKVTEVSYAILRHGQKGNFIQVFTDEYLVVAICEKTLE